jgi:hypothetical protein
MLAKRNNSMEVGSRGDSRYQQLENAEKEKRERRIRSGDLYKEW